MQELKQGTELQGGKYVIKRVLGQGGFGITYLAEQVLLGRDVAIKEFFMKDSCLRDETTGAVSVPSTGSAKQVEQYRKKFLKEARMIASFRHPHIVSIIDVFEENNTVYYSMPYMDGGSLKSIVERNGRLPETDALRYICQVADALRYMHQEMQSCHYDVKPDNIMVDYNHNAVLIDFGISKNYDAQGKETSATPIGISDGFAPVEQYQGISGFSPASDVYALGATLYYLVEGHTPPTSPQITQGAELQMVHASEEVKALINNAMEIMSKNRPQETTAFMRLASEMGAMDKPSPDQSRPISEVGIPTPVVENKIQQKRIKCPKCGVVLVVRMKDGENVRSFRCPSCDAPLKVTFNSAADDAAPRLKMGTVPLPFGFVLRGPTHSYTIISTLKETNELIIYRAKCPSNETGGLSLYYTVVEEFRKGIHVRGNDGSVQIFEHSTIASTFWDEVKKTGLNAGLQYLSDGETLSGKFDDTYAERFCANGTQYFAINEAMKSPVPQQDETTVITDNEEAIPTPAKPIKSKSQPASPKKVVSEVKSKKKSSVIGKVLSALVVLTSLAMIIYLYPWHGDNSSGDDKQQIFQSQNNGNISDKDSQLILQHLENDMVRVMGGTFIMGRTDEQGDEAACRVTLSDFHICKYEVTQELWQAVMGSNPSNFPGDLTRPVESVSWEECQEFITKLNEMTGKQYRLPTEAEWEFAARERAMRANGTCKPVVNDFDIKDMAWYMENSGDMTHPVGTKLPNELGLYDMNGNVWEWCQDWYGDYVSGHQTNPTGPRSGSIRVCRGGSWNDTESNCHLSRLGLSPSVHGADIGLRLAMDAD